MPIIRCKDQKRQTLEEFYSDWASDKNPISANVGKSDARASLGNVLPPYNLLFIKKKTANPITPATTV